MLRVRKKSNFVGFLNGLPERAVEESTKELFGSFGMAAPAKVVTIAVFTGAANSALGVE